MVGLGTIDWDYLTSMSEAQIELWFPELRRSGYRITSPLDPLYNCVAWAAMDDSRWWEPFNPDAYWPDGLQRDDTVDGFIALFQSLGFEVCNGAEQEPGFTKIAIYGSPSGAFTHVSRQLPSGAWTSKLGEAEDIEHANLDGLNSRDYGAPARLMKRMSA